jgi:pantoate--beta-alanine ligase
MGRTIGLVPTMGYLHEGHLALMHAARAENDVLVASIFVNPTQFGPSEDFDRYPRDIERDRGLAGEAAVDLLFVPDTETMYPGGPASQEVWVDPGRLDDFLCGASRPGHFRGVAGVVAKLFAMVNPDRAYFGQKDAQQAIIISRMVRDLAFPIEVRVVPTVREADGLALSSRNVYLSPEQRREAPSLHHGLENCASAIGEGERNAQVIENLLRRAIAGNAPSGRVDYATVADMDSLQPVQGQIHRDVLVAVAVYFGETRLIDNVMVRFDAEGRPSFS